MSASCADVASADLDDRVILHLDIDCFYAQVEAVLEPCLKGLPLAVRQKNFLVGKKSASFFLN